MQPWSAHLGAAGHGGSGQTVSARTLIVPEPVLALMGPTASGKSALAERLAEAYDAELISVDSALV